MGHSILQQDMPDEEDYYCEPTKRRKRRYSPSDVNTGNRSVHYHGQLSNLPCTSLHQLTRKQKHYEDGACGFGSLLPLEK